MGVTLDHIRGSTFHGRRGAVQNAFRYDVDYLLLDEDTSTRPFWLFSRDRRNIMALHSRDHGGTPGDGFGFDWVRAVMIDKGLMLFLDSRIQLLAQPRIWGRGFNPVSFWLIYGADDTLRIVIAEVNNTFGERHSYLCHKDDFSAIEPADHITADKIFYVSPFQPVEGGYGFRFEVDEERVGIFIDYRSGEDGVFATLTGRREALTDAGILRILLRRPLGFMRVMSLIYWQALRLKIKGALFRRRGTPPSMGVS
ncbi:MAG: DUF1365 domain-containing protein [Pseudomonadota bacterium]